MGPLSFAQFARRRSSPPLLATSKTSDALIHQSLTLVEHPRCPRCRRATWGHWKRSGDGIHKCEKCGQHWWTMVLAAGAVLEQLERAFEDAAIAAQLVAEYQMPAALPRPMCWQLPLTSNQVHNHHRSPLAVLFRAVGILKVIR